MKKNSILYSLATLLTGAVAMSGLTACSEVDNAIENGQLLVREAPVYHVSIPATMGGEAQTRAVSFDPSDMETITTSFKAGEKVYVYNETKHVFACSGTYWDALLPLTVDNISDDGLHCTLSGDLTFYKKSGSDWIPVEVETGDTYSLYYQMNGLNAQSLDLACFDYGSQEGTAAGVTARDFAEVTGVTLTKSGNTLTVGSATFKPLQAMLRQTLTFEDGSTTVTPTIKQLRIISMSEALIAEYKPMGNDYRYPCGFTNLDGSDLYAALRFDYDDEHPAANDKIVVWAEDDEGYAYKCAKAAPSGGFVSGKYYYGTMTLYRQPKLTVTRTDTDPEQNVERKSNGKFELKNDSEKKYTVSGAGFGEITSYINALTMTLADGTELIGGCEIVFEEGEPANVILGGNATIDGYFSAYCWFGENFALITSSGGPYTLTVNDGGIWGNLRLCKNVTILTTKNNGSIKDATGTDITPTDVTVNGKKYKQFVGSGTFTPSE